MPLDMTNTSGDHWLAFVLDFITVAFELWQSLILSWIVYTSFYLARYVYQINEPFDWTDWVQANLMITLTVLGVQGLYNKIGFLFIELDMLREGND